MKALSRLRQYTGNGGLDINAMQWTLVTALSRQDYRFLFDQPILLESTPDSRSPKAEALGISKTGFLQAKCPSCRLPIVSNTEWERLEKKK